MQYDKDVLQWYVVVTRVDCNWPYLNILFDAFPVSKELPRTNIRKGVSECMLGLSAAMHIVEPRRIDFCTAISRPWTKQSKLTTKQLFSHSNDKNVNAIDLFGDPRNKRRLKIPRTAQIVSVKGFGSNYSSIVPLPKTVGRCDGLSPLSRVSATINNQ